MAAGKHVRRDVFTFNERNFTTSDDQALAEKWGKFVVPALNNIDVLVRLLQPWLKAKETKVLAIEQLKKHIDEDNECKSNNLKTLETNEQLNKIASTIDLLHTPKIDQPEPLNLELYTQNQGAPELAAIMLDEYIADIDELLKKLSDAIKEQNYPLGISLTNNLMKTGIILAAQNFTEICHQLLVILNKGVTTEHQQVMVLFGQLIHQKTLLNQFSEAM